MYKMIKIYFLALFCFFVIDMIWLVGIAKNFYRDQIGFLMTDQINWWAAGIFYLLFIAALLHFVILPYQNDWKMAVLQGALFGFITYATYDLTNLATLKNWPILVTIVDLCWGTFLCAAITGGTLFLARFI